MVLIVTATILSARDAAKPMRPTSQETQSDATNEKWMIEGQRRFLANCGRCHQSPHLFSPREMSMAVRHMRVRAMLTQEDMDYVLYYITHQ
jgi:mono/diheme cytochrome c family protein